MANELVNMADSFKGLDMGALIGGPLVAVCAANRDLALSAAEYIDKVGMNSNADGSKTARMVTFSATKPNIAEDGTVTQQTVTFQAPFLALVEVPNLFVRKVEIRFNMEVKSSFTATSESAKSAALEASVKFGWGMVSGSAKISGSISSKDSSTRSSDNSAKYDVYVVAEDRGMPEGMAKVLDIMKGLIAPTEVKTLTDSGGTAAVATPAKTPVAKPAGT